MRKYIAAAVLFLLLGAVAYAVFKHFGAALVGGAAGALLGILMFHFLGRKDSAGKPGQPVKQPAGPEEELQRILHGLLELNISARVESIETPALEKFEEVIDMLRELVPQMVQRYPGEELTYECKRMATTHLPKLIRAFISHTRKERGAKMDGLVRSLDFMRGELAEVKEVILQAKSSDFVRVAAMIKMKYSSGPVGG